MSIPPMNIPPLPIASVCLPDIVSVPPPSLYLDPPPYVRMPLPPTNQPPPYLFPNLPPLSVPPPPASNISPGLSGCIPQVPGTLNVSSLPPQYPTIPIDTSVPPPYTPSTFSNVQSKYYDLPPPPPKEFAKPTSEEYYKKTSEYLSKDGNGFYKPSKHRYSPLRDFDKEKNKHYEKERYRRYETDRERSYDRDKREREYKEYKETKYRSSRSPSRSSRSHRSRSPSRSSYREYDRERERYYRERHHEERREYERRRHEYERRHSISRPRDMRSMSHSSRDSRSHRSPSRHSHRSPSKESFSRSRTREPREHAEQKPLTDREKILREYEKNYCRTSKDFIEKMEKWSQEHHSEDEEVSKMWYRSSPAELYYKQLPDGKGAEQTNKLEKICKSFFTNLIERGRKARPVVDELPLLKAPKGKMCKHKMEEGSSSSSESEDECLDEDGLQGFTDRIMLELQRKQNHPRRLNPELWFNNTGEMNFGPLCRCSARARRFGMRHGVYAGEHKFPKCIPNQSNLDKLFHYRITVSPPTNFLIKAPTIIGHDEHEFLFSGFSMFSHYKLSKLPTCKVIRFNIEYTILYVEEAAPQNFTVEELDLFEEYLFKELLELVDLDLGKATETSCSQFHFMPRFVRMLSEGGCEVLSMCEVLKYLLSESGLLIPPETLNEVHAMDHYSWQKFVDRIKGMIVTYPGKKPCSLRVDQLDRSPPESDAKDPVAINNYYPEIVHFGIRPPQLSYAGNPEYQKAWRYYVKYRHLIANMAKPSVKERQKLAAKEAKLQEMRTQSKMKRDVTVAISSEGFHMTGLMCDIVQHAMLIPVLVRHLRFHKSLDTLESKIGYVFKQRHLLQTALTHPSYRENFGTNPDHARNSLTNCGIRQPEYGDRRIHYTRKKGIVTLIKIMARFGKANETESEIKHNERLEFLGDAVVEFLSSIHLFKMFPSLAEGGLATYRAAIVQNQHLAQLAKFLGDAVVEFLSSIHLFKMFLSLDEGGLATYRAAIVQNQHLAQLAKNIELEQFMLYVHGSDLCRDVVMRHAMANCFEALMGALFLDAGLEVADRVFALALWYNEPELLEVWTKERLHPLQEQEPTGDRKYIKDFEFLQKLTDFEKSIGVEFKHIRLLARAFTDRSVGFTHLTLGSNQRLEFLGDTVLQLLVSDTLYRHFPAHHEGHLSLLRSSLVNNRTQAMVCDDLDMSSYAIYNNPKAKPTTKKHKADLLEAFLGSLFIDKNLEYCQAFCNACLFPRLQEFIMNQDWNDPKSKLQQCCLTLRSMEGGEPDIPVYKVIECLGPTNTRVYTVGVYFRGKRLAAARGHSIQEAEMNAAEEALSHELFPQLDHQKRVIAKSMKKKSAEGRNRSHKDDQSHESNDKTPKAYRLGVKPEEINSSDEENAQVPSEDEGININKFDDSGLDSDAESIADDKLENVQVSSLLSDMEKIKEELIRKKEYEKLKEKCRKSDSDDDY